MTAEQWPRLSGVRTRASSSIPCPNCGELLDLAVVLAVELVAPAEQGELDLDEGEE